MAQQWGTHAVCVEDLSSWLPGTPAAGRPHSLLWSLQSLEFTWSYLDTNTYVHTFFSTNSPKLFYDKRPSMLLWVRTQNDTTLMEWNLSELPYLWPLTHKLQYKSVFQACWQKDKHRCACMAGISAALSVAATVLESHVLVPAKLIWLVHPLSSSQEGGVPHLALEWSSRNITKWKNTR